MKKQGIFSVLINLKREFISALNPKSMKGHKGKSFTRKRKLRLGRLLTLVLRCSLYSLQIRLDDYFKEIGHREETASKQAFSKARTNLAPDIVKSSFVLTAQTLSGCEDFNLKAKHLSRKEDAELYFKRWRIEVKFDSLKNKLELENMSGRRVVTTYPDFSAKLDLANTMPALEYTTNEVIEEKSTHSDPKYQQITNKTHLITKF